MGLQPSEFWAMSLQEFVWLVDARQPRGRDGRGPRFSEAERAELIAWDKQHNGN